MFFLCNYTDIFTSNLIYDQNLITWCLEPGTEASMVFHK